jgi:general nucleoside transport system ATP-binding protein
MLRLVDLEKHFGAVHAVEAASLEVQAGRVHAVVGENGAGKSTLLKMAAGILAPDRGEVVMDGQTLSPHSAREAIRRGIAMVQQHFALIGVMTTLENVVLGVEPVSRGILLDLRVARAKVEGIARELGVALPLDATVESLGVGDRQRLEIARALYRDARVVILDEPTAVLTHGEAETLYATLRRLADNGRAIVVVTHKLGEVTDHADDVTVMRKGKVILTRKLDRAAREKEIREISDAIMGGGVPPLSRRESGKIGAPVIIMSDVFVGQALRGLNLEVRAGEIVGIAGVEGNGQRELVQVLAGLVRADSGRVSVVERPILGKRASAVAVVHEDRQKEGLVLDADLTDNVLLGELKAYSKYGVLDVRAMLRDARERLDRAHADYALDAPARTLSGGNQQKIVMARAIAKIEKGASALVLAHPTRGVDLGASRAIHQEILSAAAKQVAVLIVSSDLAELRAVCDRILVLANGRIVADLTPSATDQEIGRMMLSAGHA